MQTRLLGPGGPAVTAVGFGGMPLSIHGRPSEATAMAVIHKAMERGPVLLDTADVYCMDDRDLGHNERLFATALRTWPGDRGGVIVATKGGLTRPSGRWERDGRPEQLEAACDRSLAALDVDCIDLYQLHAPDPRVPFAESVGALARLKGDGKIARVGLSNVSVDQIREANAITPITSVQNRLNPYFREALETGVVEHCRSSEIGFLAYSPVGGGRLNKKLPAHPALTDLSVRHGASAHAVVLAWVMAQAPNVIPIPGARTVPHVLDSASAADLTLTAQELARIDHAAFDKA